MQQSKQLSAQPNKTAAADARVDQPCINPATARSLENTAGETINTSKGEKATRKKSKILLVFRVSKSAPCNTLESPVAPQRRTQTRGVFPLFPGAVQAASEIFQVLGNPSSQPLLS